MPLEVHQSSAHSFTLRKGEVIVMETVGISCELLLAKASLDKQVSLGLTLSVQSSLNEFYYQHLHLFARELSLATLACSAYCPAGQKC